MDELRFFGADETRKEFAVFELNRENEMNMFIWVFPDHRENERVYVEFVTRIYSYLNHAVSPFAVREEDCKEIIEDSLVVLEEYPKELLNEKFKQLEDEMGDDGMFGEDWFREWDEAEEKMFQEVEKAREDTGYWPWTPN